MMTPRNPSRLHLLLTLALPVIASANPLPGHQQSAAADHASALLVVTDSGARNTGLVEAALATGREQLLSVGAARASHIAVSLDSSTRTRDVFGGRIRSEPVMTAPAEPDAENQRRLAAVTAIDSLVVTGVAPQRAEAYVENWILRPGDGVQVTHDGKAFLFEVDSVDGESIAFIEAEDGFRVMARLQVIPDPTPAEMNAVRQRSP